MVLAREMEIKFSGGKVKNFRRSSTGRRRRSIPYLW